MSVAFVAAAGVLTWTLLEYCIHRWLGHDRRFKGNLFEREHTTHHSRGNYFAPWWKKAGAALAAMVLVGAIASWIGGLAHGLAFAGGLTFWYLGYEIIHRRAHTHSGIGAYGRWLRRHHFYHHFVGPKYNHGVTTSLWDHVFGTWRAPEQIPVPRKLAMIWLLDDHGDVAQPWREAYRLRS